MNLSQSLAANAIFIARGKQRGVFKESRDEQKQRRGLSFDKSGYTKLIGPIRNAEVLSIAELSGGRKSSCRTIVLGLSADAICMYGDVSMVLR